jgi:site-specific recombinase XerD
VLWLFDSGHCRRCYSASPHLVTIRAANLAAELTDPPLWIDSLAEYLIARYHPGRACALLTGLRKALSGSHSRRPAAILARITAGWQLQALRDFFASHRLALPADNEEHRAAGRRQRRIDAVPLPLRPVAAAFAEHLLNGRRRARTAGAKPRSHQTIDARLNAVRDFAHFVTAAGKNDWALANSADVEVFLAARNTKAPHLTGLKQFFGFAARRKLILINQARDLHVPQPFGFRGPTLSKQQQRQLFHRWTTQPGIHPNETFTGLIALLHGATTTEICALTLDRIDHQKRSIRLGRRPHPLPLDPWTWTALTNCITHRESLRSNNQHLIVTAMTRGTRAAPSAGYVKHTLDPVGLQPRILRSSRLLDLVTTIDPKLVSATYGMTREAVTAYLADRIDPSRLGELVKLQPKPRT